MFLQESNTCRYQITGGSSALILAPSVSKRPFQIFFSSFPKRYWAMNWKSPLIKMSIILPVCMWQRWIVCRKSGACPIDGTMWVSSSLVVPKPHVSLPMQPAWRLLSVRYGGDCVDARLFRPMVAQDVNVKLLSVYGVLMRFIVGICSTINNQVPRGRFFEE